MKKYNLDDYEPFTQKDAEMLIGKSVQSEVIFFENGNVGHEKIITEIKSFENGYIIIGNCMMPIELSLKAISFADGSPFGKLKKKSNLDIAKEKYKAGMKVRSAVSQSEFIIRNSFKEAYGGINHEGLSIYNNEKNKWAEILPLITTEDGVDVFDPEQILYYAKHDKFEGYYCQTKNIKDGNKYFYTKEACEEYVKKNEKNLIYFENIVVRKYDYFDVEKIPDWIYWQLVLKEILDYYSGDEEREYCIVYSTLRIDYHHAHAFGLFGTQETPFNLLGTQEACKKTIKLMGENLDFIYKKQ